MSMEDYNFQKARKNWGDADPPPLTTKDWFGLTDEEVGVLTVSFHGLHHIETPLLAKFIRAIESKLKEKNT